ncbi:MAG: hypothetical protein RBT74_12710 [Tenuifilaceae bacterium]|jgi:hypothetical protein|nr:hypothetical protein [Tenuifilaceae bacterium]
MRKIFFLLPVLLQLQLFAQTNFREGYILKTETDTIYGKINNRSYHENALFCEFMDSDGNVQRFTPNDIYGYKFKPGKYYVARQITVNDQEKLVFVEYLVNGKLDIFFFQDHMLNNYYFAAKDSLSLKEIKYSQQVVERDGKHYLKQSRDYLVLMGHLTSDAPNVHDKLNKLGKPTHNDLISFARSYHHEVCSDEECIVYEKRLPLKFIAKASGGGLLLFGVSEKKVLSLYRAELMLQQPVKSESIYVGIGVEWIQGAKDTIDPRFRYLIPISINYHSPRSGISPLFSYKFYLDFGFGIHVASIGLKWQKSKLAFTANANLCYALTFPPQIAYTALNIGVAVDLN